MPFVVTLVLALLLPAPAQAACGVPAKRAIYETPAVQVYERGDRVLGCHRATGRARTVGIETDDGMGTRELVGVNAVIGGRWVWTSLYGAYAESADVRIDTLTDLRTGRSVGATVEDETTSGDAQALALRGALIVSGDNGVTASFTKGGRQVLSRSQTAGALAAVGARVYWSADGAPGTALLELPAADEPVRRPLARTSGRCRPRAGARLLESFGPWVVSRAGGSTWVCRNGRTRRLVQGDVREFAVVGEREIAYARAGFVGLLDVVNGTRRELPSEGGPLAANNLALLAGGAAGLSAWVAGESGARQLLAEPVAELAVGYGTTTVAYWIDGTGAPRSLEIGLS